MEKSVGESSADCSIVMVLDGRRHIDQKTGNDAVEKSVGESSADCSIVMVLDGRRHIDQKTGVLNALAYFWRDRRNQTDRGSLFFQF